MLIGSAIAVGRRIKRREDFRGGLRSWLGAAWIELRHSPGWLALPVLIALAGALLWGSARGPVMIWAETSSGAHFMVTLAGPVTAGLAAWVASRERRRDIEDLLSTTPRPELQRRLATLAATAAVGVICYALAVGALFSVTAVRATWGGPEAWPIVVAVIAIAAQAALGYAVGLRLQSRFTAPLVAVGLFVAQTFAVSVSDRGWIPYLSPAFEYDYSAWFGVQPVELMPWQALFVAGVGVVAVAAISLGRTRALIASATLALGLSLAVSGAVAISQTAPEAPQPVSGEPLYDEPLNGYETRPVEMVCNSTDIPVCVHPAYEPLLPSLSQHVEPMTAPLAGVPGAPERVQQLPSASALSPGEPREGTAGFIIDNVGYGYAANIESYNAAHDAAAGLVIGAEDIDFSQGSAADTPNEARRVIQAWLMQRAGMGECSDVAPGVCEAADRFSELERDERRDWLRDNYRELRAGELRLRDMP